MRKAAIDLVFVVPPPLVETAVEQDLLSVEYEDNMQGDSFKQVIFADSLDARPLYFDDVREHVSVDGLLDDGLKLIVLKDETYELYDLLNDPLESKNVADDQGDRVHEMLAQIHALRNDTQARQAVNLQRLDGMTDNLTPEEKKALEKQLKGPKSEQ